MIQSTQILLASRPIGEPQDENFSTVVTTLPDITDGQILLRIIYLSLDPYMRGHMSAGESYVAPGRVGSVIAGGTVCEVLASKAPELAVGDVVLSYSGWQTHAIADACTVHKLDPARAPISTALGVLGMPGFTAYAGLLQFGNPRCEETVVVAAAAGPVGSVVGQVARLRGARAVGIAGGPEKCAALREVFGFDAAVDHRSSDFVEQLSAAVPDGIDVYFENVGGAVTREVFRWLNKSARIPVCGLVAEYNGARSDEVRDPSSALLWDVLRCRLWIRGFDVSEFDAEHYDDFIADMSRWVRDGSVCYREDIASGLANAPAAFRGLLQGNNFGKMLVKVGQDPTR